MLTRYNHLLSDQSSPETIKIENVRILLIKTLALHRAEQLYTLKVEHVRLWPTQKHGIFYRGYCAVSLDYHNQKTSAKHEVVTIVYPANAPPQKLTVADLIYDQAEVAIMQNSE